jgi:tRNA pseudouridine38-40 synthase
MIHQIRKMIGMVIMLVRTQSKYMDFFSSTKVSVPKAPALGLLLERPIFDLYNKSKKCNVSFEDYHEQIDSFKEAFIYSHIIRQEEESGHFLRWKKLVDYYASDYQYLLRE